MAAFLGRLVVGAIAGLIIGALVAIFAVQFYPKRLPPQSLAEHEAAEVTFVWTVLAITAVVVALFSAFAGHRKLGRHMKAVSLGVLAGVAIAVLGAHVAAYERNEWPFRQKASQASITWGRNIGVPICGVLGGIIGFAVSRARRAPPLISVAHEAKDLPAHR